MLNLMFIRHAQTELNKEGIFAGRTDCSITKEAYEEAREVFKDIEKNFDYIYCFPLKRTKQTLDAILPNSTPIIDERTMKEF